MSFPSGITTRPEPHHRMRKKSPRLPITDWNIDLAVKIEGIKLPFRLRCITSDPDVLMGRLDEFMDMIRLKIHDEIDG